VAAADSVNALQATETALEGAPRIGPVPGATSRAEAAYRAAERLGITLYPWQRYSLWISLETNEQGKLRYFEDADVVARQNGKTEELIPRIVADLDEGRRVLHTAQNRIIPRHVFIRVAHAYPWAKVRYANGQEEIRLSGSGGSYTIIAPQKGVRGHSADTLIIDEIREYESFDFIAAAEPTLTASTDPQVVYRSNAGDEDSIVLNDLRARALSGAPGLAYKEWSADPALAVDDREGWLQANPSIGYGPLTIDRIQALYEKYRDANELSIFETEHLCRWVVSMAPAAVADVAWQQARGHTEEPVRPFMGISVSSDGSRASVAYAWRQSDGKLGLIVRDFTGSPINKKMLATDLEEQAKADQVQMVGFDPWTDQDLARYFDKAKAINGQEYANASERFVRAVETGELVWQHAQPVSDDRPYTARKHTGTTAWIVEPARSDRSITGFLAAIRAVWLASAPPLTAEIY